MSKIQDYGRYSPREEERWGQITLRNIKGLGTENLHQNQWKEFLVSMVMTPKFCTKGRYLPGRNINWYIFSGKQLFNVQLNLKRHWPLAEGGCTAPAVQEARICAAFLSYRETPALPAETRESRALTLLCIPHDRASVPWARREQEKGAPISDHSHLELSFSNRKP